MIATTPSQRTDLATGEVVTTEIVLLDPQSPTGITTVGDRVDSIATLSLGGKSPDGSHPVINRDCKITLHDPLGRAEHLKRALDATGYKRLTIALASNDPAEYLHQWFAKYSATRLDAYGDAHSITTVSPDGDRQTFFRGDQGYLDTIRECKAIFDIYFILAEWTPNGDADFRMEDGLGQYRIRTTSRNSSRAFAAAVKMLSRFTGGFVAGVPIDISAELQDVMTPDGKRQKLPIWQFQVRPPGGIRGGRALQMRLGQAVQQGQLLQLAAPRVESPDQWDEGTFREIPDEEVPLDAPQEPGNAPAPGSPTMTDRDAAILAGGGLCEFDHWRNTWFATVDGTPLDDDGARAGFIQGFTSERWSGEPQRWTDSLSDFLHSATEADASALVAAAAKALDEPRRTAQAQRVDERTQAAASTSKPTNGERLATKAQQTLIEQKLKLAAPSLLAQVGEIDYGSLSEREAVRIIGLLDGKRP